MSSLNIISTAAGVLTTMVRSMSVSSTYPTSDWVESTLKPIFRVIAKHMDRLDGDLKTNEHQDWITRTIVTCLLLGLTVWCGFLTLKQVQTTNSVRKMSQAIQILAEKNQIVKKQEFPAKF